MTSAQRWWLTLPKLATAALLIHSTSAAALHFGYLLPRECTLDWTNIHHQPLRYAHTVVTSFLIFDRLSLAFLFQLTMLVSYLRYSETKFKTAQGAAQLVTAILAGATMLLVLSWLIPTHFHLLSTPLLFFIIFFYCYQTPTDTHQITESIAIQNWSIPWVVLLLAAALSIPAVDAIAGIGAGYAYIKACAKLRSNATLPALPGMVQLCTKLGLGTLPSPVWQQTMQGHKAN